ncbi:MAG TPA: hypothetical protein PLW86_17715, partial [Rhodocyclaceae bacterium]|nr:hypothetical protein [Rhodocyclaceae bacterium]
HDVSVAHALQQGLLRGNAAPARQPDAQRQGRQSIKEAVLAIRRFEGIQEPIVFNEFGDMKRNLFITVVRDGQFVVVK